MTEIIPVCRPRLPDLQALRHYVEQIDSFRIYSNSGPLVQRLEVDYASFFSVEPSQVVAVSNATVGLTALLSTSPESVWRLPAWSFTATAMAILNAGKFPEFVDVDLTTWTTDLLKTCIESGRSAGKGLLWVAPFGAFLDVTTMTNDQRHVVDAAASIASYEGGLRNLPESVSVAFSLHATKVLGAGEGGLLVIGDPEHAERVRRWINFGMDDNRNSVQNGTNGKMAEILAAYGLAALSDWEQEKFEWARARGLVESALLAEAGVQPSRVPGTISPYLLVEAPEGLETGVILKTLQAQGIGTRLWWPQALPDMPAFQSWRAGDTPIARSLAKRVVGLPMFRDLTASDATKIGRALELAYRP